MKLRLKRPIKYGKPYRCPKCGTKGYGCSCMSKAIDKIMGV